MLSIAICFFGLTRSLKYTFQNILDNIYGVLDEHKIHYDVYLHTYNLTNLTNPRSNEHQIALNASEYALLRPTYYHIGDQSSFFNVLNMSDYLKRGDAWKDNGHSAQNVLCQYQSLNLVTEMWLMRQEETSYDLILYLRPDLLYNRLNVSDLWYAYEHQCILLPNYHQFGGYNDRFAVGPPYKMRVYGQRIQWLREYAQGRVLHGESFLKHLLTPLHPEETFSLRGKRIRANGMMNPGDRDIY